MDRTKYQSSIALIALALFVATGTSAEVLRNPTFAGASINCAGSGYALQGTVGESGIVGRSAGDGHVLVAGFWGTVNGALHASGVETDLPTAVRVNLRAVPNPFNPSTVFLFNQPRPGVVSLRIFDLSGRLVQELDAGVRQARPQSLRWNGRDRGGAKVSSGQYFARLTLDGAPLDQVLKVTLVK